MLKFKDFAEFTSIIIFSLFLCTPKRKMCISSNKVKR